MFIRAGDDPFFRHSGTVRVLEDTVRIQGDKIITQLDEKAAGDLLQPVRRVDVRPRRIYDKRNLLLLRLDRLGH